MGFYKPLPAFLKVHLRDMIRATINELRTLQESILLNV